MWYKGNKSQVIIRMLNLRVNKKLFFTVLKPLIIKNRKHFFFNKTNMQLKLASAEKEKTPRNFRNYQFYISLLV